MQPEILRIADVIKMLRISRTTLWRYIKNGSFPSPLALGDEGSRCVGWYAREVKDWLDNRPRKTGEVGQSQPE